MADLPLVHEPGYAPGFLAWLKRLPTDIHNVVEQYGADPTGIVDAGPAFQAAWNAAEAVGGGTVYLPPGKYLLDTDVVVLMTKNSHRYIAMASAGWGEAEIIAGPNCTTMFRFMSTGVATSEYSFFLRIENIVFDGNKTARTAIRTDFLKHFHLVACGFGFFAGTVAGEGVLRTEASEWVQVWGCQWWNNGVDPDGTVFAVDTICYANTNTNFGSSYQNNIFGPDNANGIYLDSTSQGNLTMGNHFAFHPVGYSMLVQGFKLTIEGNYVYPFQGTAGLGPSIPQQGIVLDNCHEVLVTGNFFEDALDPLIILRNNARMCFVKDNFIQESGELASGANPSPAPEPDAQIRVESTAGANNTIEDNTFFNGTCDHHIKVENIGGTMLTIKDNVFVDAPGGASAGEDIFIDPGATNVRMGRHYFPSVGYYKARQPNSGPTLNPAGATPDVQDLEMVVLGQSGVTVITNFLNGFVGQNLLALFIDALSTIQFAGANFTRDGATPAVNYNPVAGEMIWFFFDGLVWHGRIGA